jgi:hypothetical protein
MAVDKLRKILYLVPDAVFENFEGEITTWLDERVQPTEEQIAAVTDQMVTDAEGSASVDKTLAEMSPVNTVQFELNFDQENRLRALESKASMTRTAYKAKLKTLYETYVL